MECWDRECLDLVAPAFIEFEEGRDGSSQFGTVCGGLDYRIVGRGGAERVEWSWEGMHDTDPGSGRGWAEIQAGDLVGRLFVHASDDSSFRAVRGRRGSPGRTQGVRRRYPKAP